MKLDNATPQDPALIFLFPKDILRVLTHINTYNGAWKHYQAIKDSLGKQKHQRITVQEFANWEGLSAASILQQLAA
jgi:hypothetical protein